MTHHRRGLRRLLKDDDILARVERDWRTADLSERQVVMLAYAVKLTASPGAVGRPDIDRLRAVDFSDRDILDLCEVIAYYAYVNRIADGLGVAVEDWFADE
jgi:uncharacterized peroxidase-related enzyme